MKGIDEYAVGTDVNRMFDFLGDFRFRMTFDVGDVVHGVISPGRRHCLLGARKRELNLHFNLNLISNFGLETMNDDDEAAKFVHKRT